MFPQKPEKMKKQRLSNQKAIWSFHRISQFSVCRMKVTFDSRKDAKREAKRVGSKVEPYDCPMCGRWHLRTRTKQDN